MCGNGPSRWLPVPSLRPCWVSRQTHEDTRTCSTRSRGNTHTASSPLPPCLSHACRMGGLSPAGQDTASWGVRGVQLVGFGSSSLIQTPLVKIRGLQRNLKESKQILERGAQTLPTDNVTEQENGPFPGICFNVNPPPTFPPKIIQAQGRPLREISHKQMSKQNTDLCGICGHCSLYEILLYFIMTTHQ